MTSTVLIATGSVAATAIVALVALAVRGIVLRGRAAAREADPSAEFLDRRFPRLSERTGRIDRTFYRLIEESGSPLDGSTALAIVCGMGLIGCAAPLVLLESLPAAVGGLFGGTLLPIGYWMFRRWRRNLAMRKHLPATLELLADALRSGRSLEQAAEMVSEDSPSPLKEEFGDCVQQLKLGHSPTAVLDRMVRRIPLPEFRIFATAVLVHRKTGGNLALLADRLAAAARDRQEFLGHVRAVTAGSRLSVVGLILGTGIAMGLLAWLRPEYLETFSVHRLGPSLLITSGVLQMVGIFWVWRVLRVQF